MNVTAVNTTDSLAALAHVWNDLARGVPFRSFDWLSNWWRHYGETSGDHLYVLAVTDSGGRIVGIAPWYIERSLTWGRVVRFLGSGEVCSDYLSLMSRPEHAPRVVTAIADHLMGDGRENWDTLDLGPIDVNDTAIAQLISALEERGTRFHRRAGPNCWRLALPETWADYEAALSKSHRKQVRRLAGRVLDSARASLQTVATPGDLEHAWEVLIDLHQRRRQRLGQPGCFASPRFESFHRSVAWRLLEAGLLRLHWLTLDGRPIAAEYHIAGTDTIFAYQSGVDPDRLEDEPGRLVTIAVLQRAIADGFRTFDFCRGDEPYKAHFRAEPRPTVQWRVISPRAAARLRHRVWLAGRGVKQWMASESAAQKRERQNVE
jgi:CelD/BcsL family acetyltransferase involved in cellulose biosynthesis